MVTLTSFFYKPTEIELIVSLVCQKRASTNISLVQTDATLLANKSQNWWMLNVATFCTKSCYVLLGIVAQSLKPAKLLSQQAPTFLLFRHLQSVAQQCVGSVCTYPLNTLGATSAHYT